MRQNGGAAVAKRKASVDGVTKMTSPLQAKDERNNNLQLSKYVAVNSTHAWLRTVTCSAFVSGYHASADVVRRTGGISMDSSDVSWSRGST